MRLQGPYEAKAVPSFAALVAESTADRKATLQPLVPVVTAACATYDAAVPDVHGLVSIKLTLAERAALINGYDGRTVAIKRRLGKMLESLPAPDADLCSYCSLDTNPDLDHFLPKAVFPEFSLHARNLVPICTPCNRKKLNAIKANGTDDRLFLYPSAEPSRNTRVLEADLGIQGQKIIVSYRIDDAGVLSRDERELVLRHYRRLGLGDRYSRRARNHMASFKASVKGYSQAAIGKVLQSKIAYPEVAEPVNGWRPALYRAVATRKPEVLAWLSAR